MEILNLSYFIPVFQPEILILVAAGVAVGIVVGCLPGLTATLGVALLIPITFSFEPFMGLMVLLGLYCGAVYGGSASALLLGIPGTPAAVATVLDGKPMADRGEAGLAIGYATISSVLGGIGGVLILAFVAEPVAKFGLAFGAREYFALGIFALTAVSQLSGGSFVRGIFSASIGLFLATIGIDAIHGIPRFIFSNYNLMAGVPYMPVMIGIFAIPEILQNIESFSYVPAQFPIINKVIPSWKNYKKYIGSLIRSSGIGTFIGAIPGTGCDIAAIVSYSQGKSLSQKSHLFGTGYPEGIVCPEAANNAATAGVMIPLLTLGIPGGAVSALLLGAFMVHGMQPGPLLMQQNIDLVYKLVIGMIVANIFVLIFGLSAARLFSKITSVPPSILSPIIMFLCVSGSFTLRNNLFDVYLMAIIGLIGYIMIKYNIPRAPLIIGMILSNMIETNLSRSMINLEGDWLGMLTPISSIIYILTLFTLGYPILKKIFKKAKD